MRNIVVFCCTRATKDRTELYPSLQKLGLNRHHFVENNAESLPSRTTDSSTSTRDETRSGFSSTTTFASRTPSSAKSSLFIGGVGSMQKSSDEYHNGAVTFWLSKYAYFYQRECKRNAVARDGGSARAWTNGQRESG